MITVINVISQLMHWKAFADCSISPPLAHLDEGVQSLAVHLQELRLNVQHVNLSPSNHYSNEDTVCGAQPLTRGRKGEREGCLYQTRLCHCCFFSPHTAR